MAMGTGLPCFSPISFSQGSRRSGLRWAAGKRRSSAKALTGKRPFRKRGGHFAIQADGVAHLLGLIESDVGPLEELPGRRPVLGIHRDASRKGNRGFGQAFGQALLEALHEFGRLMV